MPPISRLRFAFAVASLFALPLARPAGAAVILSELCDPQNNYVTDRFIEIFNTGPGPVALTGWSVVAIANNVDVTTWTLSGTINAGQAMVCGNNTTVTGFTVHFQNAQWGASGYFNWNGRAGDGAKLIQNAVVVDQVLATGTLFENADLVRNASVTTPSPTFQPSEWTAAPVVLATNASPGSHNGSAPGPIGPAISAIVTDPAAPAAGEEVHVQASVVAGSGEIAGVTLSWGTSSGSLPNVIGMPLLSGDTFRTSSPIPGQASGAVIYYRIAAQDDSASSQSPVLSYTIPGGGGGVAPSVLAVGEMSDSTLLVFFSEPVEPVTAQTPANYTVGALVAVSAVRDPIQTSQVLITVRGLQAGTRTVTVNGVTDLDGSTAFGATRSFNYVDVSIPPGYYDGLAGLKGSALQVALHEKIKGHTSVSYSGALTSFQTTDVKPNGKVWDVYSDVPGGVPPYEYSFGQTGQGATEGLGYNREHSFPQSWFNGSGPLYSDLWNLYPTDAKVNGYRSNYAYGEVGSASVTSMNGSRLGTSATPGYSGTVFEPIDAFKGDLARSQFYIAARYLGEDGAWPGGPSNDGAQLYSWAASQFLLWSQADPPSWKERMRNGAIYVIQNNRNPFVDHPEFATLIYDSSAVVSVADGGVRGELRLANRPNPFTSRTTIGFELARRERVSLRIYDVGGRLVRTVTEGTLGPGTHRADWDGIDERGAAVPAGLFFCRLEAGASSETRLIARVR